MAYNFLPSARDQTFLMPPNMADWLPEDHLAYFVIDALDAMDTSAFYERYRADGTGRAAYEPSMMLALLIYGYCIGERSSRRIERSCHQDIAFRVICAGQLPDHVTISRFRANHEQALGEIFGEVLRLCGQAGLVQLGTLSIDGTKMTANASLDANATRASINSEIDEILAQAAAVDAAEDEAFGDARGDELPAELRDRRGRKERLAKALQDLDDERAERQQHERAETEQRAQRPAHLRGPKPKAKPPKPERRANTTDPDSRPMKCQGVFLQGYNAQAVVTMDQIALAAELTQQPNDTHQLEPVLDAVKSNLTGAGIDEPIGTVLADAGYWSTSNATLDCGADLLIATTSAKNINRDSSQVMIPKAEQHDEIRRRLAERLAVVDLREQVLKQLLNDEITIKAAASEMNVTPQHVYKLRSDYLKRGRDGIMPEATRRLSEPKLKESQAVRYEMELRLATDEGRATYAMRAKTVEPVFGQVKEARGTRRFMRRGFDACASEWKLIMAGHNLLKLWRYSRA